MKTLALWYLVSSGLAGTQYLGPFPQGICQMAGLTLKAEGVQCKQAIAHKTCPVQSFAVQDQNNNAIGTYTICPVFE